MLCMSRSAILSGLNLAIFDISRLRLKTAAAETDVGPTEGIGAANFLDLNDIPVFDESEAVDPRSIIGHSLSNRRAGVLRRENAHEST